VNSASASGTKNPKPRRHPACAGPAADQGKSVRGRNQRTVAAKKTYVENNSQSKIDWSREDLGKVKISVGSKVRTKRNRDLAENWTSTSDLDEPREEKMNSTLKM
jgi:hypothetical protein